MRILIINLDRCPARLEFQQRQMQHLGLGFERLRAVTSAELDPAVLNRLASQWERPLRPNEVACLKSHQSAWRTIATGTEPVLVLEDDALLAVTTPAVLAALATLDEFDHVTLETRGRKKLLGRTSVPLTGTVRAVRLYQDRTGAAAYVLWPRAAQRLLARSAKAAGLADALLAASYDLRSYQVEPAGAIQLDQCAKYGLADHPAAETSIGTAGDPKPSPRGLVEALIYRRRRMAAQLRMGWRQVATLGRAGRRIVTLHPADFQSAAVPSEAPRAASKP